MELIFVIRDPEVAGSNPIAPPATQKFGYFLPAFSTHTKGTHIPKSGVKFTVFVQICPIIGVGSRNLCSSLPVFRKVGSALQWF
jgi:hypothetical protein